ncbi:MAG: M35 family metallo-endopeptidase, partial [Treponema sp.]
NGNLYHYAGNNPVRYIDPDGNETAEDFPSVDSLNSAKKSKFESSKFILENHLDEMISVLKNYDVNSDLFNTIKESANKWLKIKLNSKESSSNFADKLQHMKSTLSFLNSTTVKYDANTEYIGYVQTSGLRFYGKTSSSGKILVLGSKFFAIKIGSQNVYSIDREHALIHEMSHYCFDTNDIKYGFENCLKLNGNNADNWAFFYREIFYAKKN